MTKNSKALQDIATMICAVLKSRSKVQPLDKTKN